MYVDNNPTKLIIGDKSNSDIHNKLEQVVQSMHNPFYEITTWLKGEMYDIKAMLEAIDKRDEVEANKLKIESKKKSDGTVLERLTSGRKTLKTILKGSSSKQSEILHLQSSISVAEKDID